MKKKVDLANELQERCAELEVQLEYYKSIAKDTAQKSFRAFERLSRQIAKSRIAEKELRKKSLFAEKLINSSALSTWISDDKGTAIKANKACLDFLGATEQEVVGKYNLFEDSELIQSGFIPLVEDVFTKGVPANIVINYNFKAVDCVNVQNGTHKIINTILTPILDDDGKVSNVIVQAIDLTDIQKIETKLQESLERFHRLAENSPDMIYRMSLPDGVYEYVSPAVEKILGYTPDEFYRSPLLIKQIIHPDWQDYLALEWKKLLSGEVSPIYEYQIMHKSGESRWVNQRNVLLKDDSGAPVAIEGIVTDITAHKDAEVELRQKHKMEAVGYMAGGMAHNFNNNLSIILGNVELSLLKLPKDSELVPFLENAKIAIRRSRDLVLKIITYSRKGIQNTTPIRLMTIIDETITLLSSTLPSTINLHKNISPICDSNFVLADASQIQEVLINLCNNAVHAMNEKGHLTISLNLAELSDEEIPAQYDGIPGRYAKLSVQDSGCGMPAGMLDKIFDPFFTTKEEHEGAGMGLATVQGIVAQHGGVIKVNSLPGQGTVFDLYFPVIDKSETEPKSNNEDMPKGTEKILFIDDDEILAALGEALLSEMGYQVTRMTESPGALKLFSANPDYFDMVISDQTMPDLTGMELLQKVKEIRPDMRTILCTGFSSQIDEGQAQQQEIDAFCMKPLDLPELLQTIRRVLGGVEKE
jgi:PAS domain S-box-containing protein